MKRTLTLCILFFISSISYAQKITDKNFSAQFDILLENLDKENWTVANKFCTELLNYVEPLNKMETEKRVLRYIKIYSTGGLLSEGKLTKEQALEKTEYLKNKEMIMPAHPFNSNCYVNCTNFAEEKNTFFSGANNKKGTSILALEWIKIKGTIKESAKELTGKYIVLSGKLNEISTEGNILPRFHLKFIDGAYEIQK